MVTMYMKVHIIQEVNEVVGNNKEKAIDFKYTAKNVHWPFLYTPSNGSFKI